MPTSSNRRRIKAGFTLLEMLIALAIMAGLAAVVLPSVQRALQSNADRRAAFHFERLALDLRANAFREERALTVVDTGKFQDDADADPTPAEIKLDEGWTYRLSGPLVISARGLCDPVDADLSYLGAARVRMHGDADCSFTWRRIGR